MNTFKSYDKTISTGFLDLLFSAHSLYHIYLPSHPTNMSMGNDYPNVFLFHVDGGHIFRNKRMLTWRTKGKPSQFKIMPLSDEHRIIDISSQITTRADYIRELISWKKVVIQCTEKGKFLKCKKFMIPGNSCARASFCDQIDKCSIFELGYCPETGTFSFKSHDGFYLHYNNTFGIVVFKLRKAKEALWYVHALDLAASDIEQILVVGVVNVEKEFIFLHTVDDDVKDWNMNIDDILNNLFSSLEVQSEGSCSMFQHPITLHQWCVTRSVGETLNIVISTEHFPKAFASECVEDLEQIFRQHQDVKTDLRLQRHGIDKADHFKKLLTTLTFGYNEQYSYSAYARANKEIKTLMEQMAANIEKLQENIVSAEALKQLSDELVSQASKFETHSSTMKFQMLRKTAILSGALIGGVSGAVVGFCIGGPGGAVILGVEAAEVAAGLCIGMLLGSSAAFTYTSRFWRRRFVSFGKKMPLTSTKT